MRLSKSKVNLLSNLFDNLAVFVHAGSKVGIIYQPVAYFVRVLWVFRCNSFNVDITHADNNIGPFQQFFGDTLGPV